MNFNKGSFTNSRAFRYGSMSIALTALIVAAVVILNVIVTALASKYMWYIDMTQKTLYSLLDEGVEILEDTFEQVNTERGEAGEEDVKVRILFCDVKDNLEADSAKRYVHHTAREMADRFPETVSVEYVNIYENPTAVNKYKSSTLTNINSSHVIVESGTEYRLLTLTSFFKFNTGETTPWAYVGDQTFITAVRAVTRAESPIACLTSNHGEAFYDYEIINMLDLAGYVVQNIDLSKDEIPEDCRLIVTYNPSYDFMDDATGNSEIAKLSAFLAENNRSFMFFNAPTTPVLPNLEEFLETWGIVYDRHDDNTGTLSSVTVKDTSQSLTSDGMSVVGAYQTLGPGAGVTADMQKVGYPAKVIFRDVMPIKFADSYTKTYGENEDEPDESFWYGSYYSNGVSRNIYELFMSSENAVAMAGGKEVSQASALEPYKLMTITREVRQTQQDNYASSFVDNSSYVIACGSIEFLKEAYLGSSTYGNSEVMQSICRQVGKEAFAATYDSSTFIRVFAIQEIETLTAADANRYTAVLSILPAALVFAAGIFVIVRRRYS